MIKLEKEERIYLIKRAHPIVLIFNVLPVLFLLIFVFFLVIYLFFVEIRLPESLNINNFYIVKNLKYYLIILLLFSLPFLWISVFLTIISYYLTFWAITDQKIIYAKFKGLFSVEYSVISYDRIQDITTYIKGILASTLRFGDIRIQTAGTEGQFVMEKIPEPEVVRQVIFENKIDYYKKYAQNSN
jgi:uncharacterized membrane protein YdbT with pleckstrin-like domain